MYFGEVDIPETLLQAQEEGNLVIFAGAGVSVPPPSGLPTFEELAQMVEKEFKTYRRIIEAENNRKEEIDGFFDRLEKDNCNVRKYITDLYSCVESWPSKVHEYLVKLFPAEHNVRIVTTNYDDHFVTAVRRFRLDRANFYYATVFELAQPDEFTGVVHLHGYRRVPNTMIFTQAGFSEAYMSDNAWARRFIESIFQKCVVLFVGYSLNDILLRYLLARIEPRKNLYSIMKTRDVDKWSVYGITPITYPSYDNGDYECLYQALRDWADYSQFDVNGRKKVRRERNVTLQFDKSLVDYIAKEKRIKKIVTKPPDEDRAPLDLIVNSLSTLSTTRFFIRHCRKIEWLYWLNKNGLIRGLFEPQRVLSPVENELASWICSNFVIPHSDAVMELIHGNMGQLNPEFWRHIIWKLTYSDDRPEPAVLARWVALLLRDVPQNTYRYYSLDYLMTKCRYPEDKNTAILLFQYLFSPTVRTEPSFSAAFAPASTTRKIDLNLTLRGEQYWLKEFWQKQFRRKLDELWPMLLPIVHSHLCTAYTLNLSLGEADANFDRESFWRSAIEPHDQDTLTRSFDVLIDAARDILVHVLEHHPEEGKGIVENWYASGVTILKRLAMHGVSVGKCWKPDEKINWLLEKDLIYKHWYKHEVFQVIKNAFQ